MGYLVQDRLEVSIYINDNEYPLDALSTLNWLHISTTFRHALPTVSMQISDVRHIFDTIGILDGTPLRVVIKPYGKDSKTYKFRKFNHKREFTGAFFTWTLYGYWDSPLYWTGSSVAALEGTANSVLQQIASTCSLAFDGVSTNDSQIWIPRNRSYKAWAKDIVNHAWINDTSCLVHGVDLDGTLRLKDFNNLPDPKIKIVAYTLADNAFTAIDVKANASSGLNNALTGYQNMRVSQTVIADSDDEVHDAISDLNWTPDVKTPHYNMDLKKQLGRGAVRFAPIDAGNLHDNYDKADYQNTRYRNLFSFGMEALMMDCMDVQLGQKVSLAIQDESTGQDTPNSGTYTVTGHGLYLQAANYSELLGLARHGTNEVDQ